MQTKVWIYKMSKTDGTNYQDVQDLDENTKQFNG